jgi:creatinine amidohydrolase
MAINAPPSRTAAVGSGMAATVTWKKRAPPGLVAPTASENVIECPPAASGNAPWLISGLARQASTSLPQLKRFMKHALILLIVCLVGHPLEAGTGQTATQADRSAPGSRIFKLEELAWPEIDALDRQRTLFILPVGMVEQHGPHLPVGADTMGVMYEANAAAARVSRALPEWNVVMMPVMNYGQGGANQLGNISVHPGTYGIRQSTLRALVADVGGQIAQNGFKWIFVLNGHGAPTQNVALNEACDFVSETFRVTMLHLTALFRGDAAIQARGDKMNATYFRADALSSFGMDVHAGVSETSGMLAVRPDLVRPVFKSLPSRAGRSFEELRQIATTPGWQGYLSSPAAATAAHGRAVEEWWIEGFTELMLRAVRGENMFLPARVPETVPPDVASILEKDLANEAAFGAKLETWLMQRTRR